VLHVVRRSPEQFGHPQSRWTLQAIRQSIRWMHGLTLSGVYGILKRLGIRYKRGRLYLHSPDPAYEAKRSRIALKRLEVQYQPKRSVLLYLDELTYYGQPSVANDYAARGREAPLARLGYRMSTYRRLIGALNAHTGQVNYWHRSKIGVAEMVDFLHLLLQRYAHAQVIYIVLDNNPMHYHPTVMSHIKPQSFPWQDVLPPSWSREVTPGSWPIEFLPLPTYASWLNPIEKLWRWLKQRVLHLHRYTDDWPALETHVDAFLDQFAFGSEALLHYVGLSPY
jgi:transposase